MSHKKKLVLKEPKCHLCRFFSEAATHKGRERSLSPLSLSLSSFLSYLGDWRAG